MLFSGSRSLYELSEMLVWRYVPGSSAAMETGRWSVVDRLLDEVLIRLNLWLRPRR